MHTHSSLKEILNKISRSQNPRPAKIKKKERKNHFLKNIKSENIASRPEEISSQPQTGASY